MYNIAHLLISILFFQIVRTCCLLFLAFFNLFLIHVIASVIYWYS